MKRWRGSLMTLIAKSRHPDRSLVVGDVTWARWWETPLGVYSVHYDSEGRGEVLARSWQHKGERVHA